MSEEAYDAAETAARAAQMSLSGWLTQAAAREARIEAGLRGVAAYEAEYGMITAPEIVQAERILDRLGVGQPAPEQEGDAAGEARHRPRPHGRRPSA